MFNSASIRAVNNSKFSQRFTRPRYDSYCFANLPATVTFLLTGKGTCALPADVLGALPTRYDKVILFFVDAFGWKLFERYANKYPFLRTVLADGVVSKMTSQFPSTTAAHVTCIHTGLDVGQSGVYEWQYYEPLVDEVISPLLFSYAGDKLTRDTLSRCGVPPSAFFPRRTFYEALQSQGVASHILQYYTYCDSTYSNIVFRGAQVHPYQALPEALSHLSDLLQETAQQPSYYFVYFDRIDATCHIHGPSSRQSEAAIDNFLTLMEEAFYRKVQGKAGNTLLIMTADHGQIEVDPRITFYLNQQMPGLERSFKTSANGRPIVPAGSPRDMFLYVKEEHVDDVIVRLQQRLAGKAEVYRTQDLLAQNFFGLHEPSPVFLARLGNVVILPYQRETVWWYEEGKFDMHFRGHHGGLTAEEMEIPLLLLPL
jgi:predicted AlkP superfamily pyrophosphatase or phosphodiesterase